MIVAGADALAHGVGSSAGSLLAAPPQLCQHRLRGRFRVAVHGHLYRHLIAELRHVDIDLRDDRAGRDKLAFLGGPLGEAGAKGENEIAFGDQLVGDGRRKAAADADRPRIAGK